MEPYKNKIIQLLRWSERYTKTDMVYVGQSGFWLILNQSVGVVISFLLSILFANFLSKEVFGMYRYVIATAGIITAFSLTGMNTAVVRAVAQGFDKIFRVAIRQQLIWSIPRFLLGMGFSIYYFLNSHQIFGFAFLIVSVISTLASITNTYGSYLVGKMQFQVNTVYSIFVSVIHFASLALVSIFIPSVVFLVLAFYGSTLLTQFFFLYRTIKKNHPTGEQIREEDVKYAKSLSLMNIFSAIATQIDNVIVYHLLGPTQLAIFIFSTILPDRIRTIFTTLSSAALPKLSEKKGSSWESLFSKMKILFLLALFIIIVYILLAPTLFNYFFPEYLSSVLYSQIYVFSLFLLPTYVALPSLLATHQKKYLYVLSTFLPIVKIFISLLLIFLWGILGAILGRIIYNTIYTFLSLFYARKNANTL